MQSLKFYQGNGYGDINSFLRDPDFKESILNTHKQDPIVKHINNIDSMMSFKDHGDKVFYRGIGSTLIPETLNSGSNVIINRGYSSSTDDRKITKSYTDNYGCCLLIFTIPKNIKTFEYKYKKGGYSESEVLIQRNTQFIIDEKSSSHPIYLARLALYNPPPPISKKNRELISLAYEKALKKMIEEDDSNLDFDSDDDSD